MLADCPSAFEVECLFLRSRLAVALVTEQHQRIAAEGSQDWRGLKDVAGGDSV